MDGTVALKDLHVELLGEVLLLSYSLLLSISSHLLTVFPPASALGSLPCVFSNWCDPPSCSLFIFLLSVPLCYNLPF